LEPLLLHPAAAAAIPNAPKPRNARLLAPPAGPLPSRVMADRMHPRRDPRKQDASSGCSDPGPFGINMTTIGGMAACAPALVKSR
jgi:hypothetical protein